MTKTTLTDLRSGLETAHQTLTAAAWCPVWAYAEPRVQQARDQLAAALAVAETPDDEVLRTGAHEALQLALRAIDTAGQFIAVGRVPTRACRWLVSEALLTLDDALSGGRVPDFAEYYG
jgi:DNA-binding transcriptional MocR family regulator